MAENTIRYDQLTTKAEILLTDLMALSDSNGKLHKKDLQSFVNFFSTTSGVEFKGSISAGTYATKEAGWYIANNSGNYIMGATTLTVDISDTLSIIIVESVIDDSNLVDIPLTITIDTTIIEDSPNAVSGGAVFEDIKELKDGTVQIIENQRNTNLKWTETLVDQSFSSTNLSYSFIDVNQNLYASAPSLVDENEHPFNYNGNALKVQPNGAFSTPNEFKLVFPIGSFSESGKSFKIKFEAVTSGAGNLDFSVRDITGALMTNTTTTVTFVANVIKEVEITVTSNGSANYYLLANFAFTNPFRNQTGYFGEHKYISLDETITPSILTPRTEFEAEKTVTRDNEADLQSQIDDLSSGVVGVKKALPLIDVNKFTVGSATNSSTITNAQNISQRVGSDPNPIFSFSSDVSINGTVPNALVQSTARKIGYLCEFEVDTQEMELIGHQLSTRFRLVVDEIIVTEQLTIPSGSPSIKYFKIDFGTKARRKIKLSIFGQFFGVNIDENGEIFAVDITNRKKFISEGDSTVEGTSTSLSNMQLFSWAGIISQKLGFNFLNSAVGGSGYLATGNQGEPNMLDRIQTYVIDESPDVFLASSGYNDLSYTGANWETVKSNANAYWDKIKLDLPNCKAIIVGIFNPNSTSLGSNYEELNEVLRIAAKRNGFFFVNPYELKSYDALGNPLTDNNVVSLITGTGNEGTPSSPIDGNRSYYIISDNIHPSFEMHRYVGVWMANEIFKILKFNLGYLEDDLIYRP